MLNMEIFIRRKYSTDTAGKIIVNVHHGTGSPGTWTGNAITYGLPTDVRVYGSDGRYIYIIAIESYTTVVINSAIVGDAARSVDLSGTTIDNVTEIPTTYQTFTMQRGIDTSNYTDYTVKKDGTGASGSWGISVTGSAGSVAWANVSGRPTNVSSFTNDSGYITSSGSCASATKATQDGDGNTISTTYMKKGVDYVTAGQKSGTTLGVSATAEGSNTTASGEYSHAEGLNTTAAGHRSHAEGWFSTTTSTGVAAHAEGESTEASNTAAHAEGYVTVASGYYSHAEGRSTIAASTAQHVEGKYNVEDANDTYAHIIGGGSSSARKNIFTVDWNGDVCAGRSNGLTNSTKLPTGADVIGYLVNKHYARVGSSTISKTTDQYGQFSLSVSNGYIVACGVDYRYWVMRHGETSFRLMKQGSYAIQSSTTVTVWYIYVTYSS